ncbi:MAG TPA: hypothetical protein VEG61_08145 [Candidatus Dormibacteraeota bacterium]|nr:hypothetical protein [Candidatus Dormibacteraeota bacterium]
MDTNEASADETYYVNSLDGLLGESRVPNKSSSAIVAYHGARSSAVLLLFALIPFAAAIQVTQSKSYASIPLNCQPGVQNQYPENATAGQTIVITTTVASACVTDYTEVIVNILPPNSSEILSTAPASPAINTVTAPATGGPWSLIVQVLWNNYPTGGTIAIFQTTITINIYGPTAISTVTSRTVASTKLTSSTIATGSAVFTVIPYSTVIPATSLATTSVSPTITSKFTFNTPSTLPSNLSSNIPQFTWQESAGALILVVVAILLVGIFALKRRRR